MSLEIDAGQVVDNRFRIDQLICRGGMASVFKATDNTTGQIVALKAPYFQYECNPPFYSRFQREEQIGVSLNHPSIIRILSVPDKSRLYMVMEYLEGETLYERLKTLKPCPIARALEIISPLCDSVEYMHRQGVIHRDLKPQNIMLCKDGSLRVMDFGLSRVAGQRSITFSGFVAAMGTPDYMAPEQVCRKPGDVRTDIYSIGAILYEMLTGSTLFQGDLSFIMNARVSGDPKAPRELNSEISPQLEEIVLRCLARDPAERYPTVADLKADLLSPERVKVTGRARHLRAPEWQEPKGRLRFVAFACAAAILIAFLIVLKR